MTFARSAGENVVDQDSVVDAFELWACRERRFDSFGRGKTRIVERLEHRAQPCRRFGMTGARIMRKTSGMRVQPHGVQAFGRLRRSWFHNTSPCPEARARTRASTNSRSERRFK